MMIEGIRSVNPLAEVQGTHRVRGASSVSFGEDTISVSENAREMADAYFLAQVAKETPDVREDLVAQVKERIKNPDYINANMLNSVADRIMAAYGL